MRPQRETAGSQELGRDVERGTRQGGGPGREDPQPSLLLLQPHLRRLEGACGWRLHRQKTCLLPTCPCESHTTATHTREGPDIQAEWSPLWPEPPVLG